jgi:hypothetical protein
MPALPKKLPNKNAAEADDFSSARSVKTQYLTVER